MFTIYISFKSGRTVNVKSVAMAPSTYESTMHDTAFMSVFYIKTSH